MDFQWDSYFLHELVSVTVVEKEKKNQKALFEINSLYLGTKIRYLIALFYSL